MDGWINAWKDGLVSLHECVHYLVVCVLLASSLWLATANGAGSGRYRERDGTGCRPGLQPPVGAAKAS
jgi:hypothetical protein